jgi:hypothetical protein
VRKGSAKVEAKDGWLAAIRGLPANPVYRYLRQRRVHPKRAWYMRRLQQLAVFAVPVLVLSWFGAEAAFLWLDPRLTGMHRAVEWLSLYASELRYSGDGTAQLLLVLVFTSCFVWFALSVYYWTVDCSLLLAPDSAQYRPWLPAMLQSSSATSRSAVIGFTTATLRRWLPVILACSLLYSLIITMLHYNGEFSLSSVALYFLIPNTFVILLRAIGLALSCCLPLILNTLLMICFGGGTRVRSVASIAGIIMVLAQIVYAIQTPIINLAIHDGLSLDEYSSFWERYYADAIFLVVWIIVCLLITRIVPQMRINFLACWPLILLLVTLYSLISEGLYNLIAYGNIGSCNYSATDNLSFELVCGAGALFNPLALPFSDVWNQASVGHYIAGPAPIEIMPKIWLVFISLQLVLIALLAQAARLAIEARCRERR